MNLSRQLCTLLVFLFFALSSCTTGYQEPRPATEAYQRTRAADFGTEIARGVQITATTQALRSAAQATATAQVLQSIITTSRTWPIVFEETFDTIDRWPSGTSTGERADGQWSLVNGRYQWQVTSKQDITWWAYPDLEPINEFYLSVELTQLNGLQSSKSGLVFHMEDDNNFYLLEISWIGEAIMYMLYQNEWQQLSSAWTVELPQMGQMLKVEVIGQGNNYLILIGDNPPVAFTDSNLERGIAGISVGMPTGEQQATWQFDNFIVRVP